MGTMTTKRGRRRRRRRRRRRMKTILAEDGIESISGLRRRHQVCLIYSVIQ